MRDALLDEEHLRRLRITRHEAHQGQFGGVLQGKAQHFDAVLGEQFHQRHERAHAVLQKNRELPHRGSRRCGRSPPVTWDGSWS
jgi:hypothetical protein